MNWRPSSNRQALPLKSGGFSVNLAHDYPKRTYTTQLFKASRNPFQVEPLWTQAILARKDKIIVQIHGGVVPRFYASARILQQHQILYLISVSISFIRLYGMLTNSRMGSSHHQTSFQFPERISINWNSLSAKLSNRARQRLFAALA
ncbi:hypothetical protein [Spirosoma migulaei]